MSGTFSTQSRSVEVKQMADKQGEQESGRAASTLQGCNCQLFMLRELEARLRDSEGQVEKLKGEIRGRQVAFGASIGSAGSANIGPYNTDITLTYRNVHANSGAYNPDTGIFTAPVKGIYSFRFSGHNISSKPMGLRLMKNGTQLVTVFNHVGGGRHETATNGMTVQLNEGDQVYMVLRANSWIIDNTNDHSTFVGHLLYSL